MWEEKISPTVVIEFLSPGTEAEDLGRFTSKTGRSSKSRKPLAKFVVYEEILKVPNYIVFDEKSQRLRFFRLVNGQHQQTQAIVNLLSIGLPPEQIALALGVERAIVQAMVSS